MLLLAPDFFSKLAFKKDLSGTLSYRVSSSLDPARPVPTLGLISIQAFCRWQKSLTVWLKMSILIFQPHPRPSHKCVICAKQWIRSGWASTHSDQSLCCVLTGQVMSHDFPLAYSWEWVAVQANPSKICQIYFVKLWTDRSRQIVYTLIRILLIQSFIVCFRVLDWHLSYVFSCQR